MSWFRARSRWGAYLALLALAFQLAISFGHVHLDHIALTSADATAIASAPSSDDPPSIPASQDVADDLCPICALIHLAGALVPAQIAPLPLPNIFGSVRREAAVAFDLTAAPGARFRARAPPFA